MKNFIKAGTVITIDGVQVTLAVDTHIETVGDQLIPVAKTPWELLLEEVRELEEVCREVNELWRSRDYQYGCGTPDSLKPFLYGDSTDVEEFRKAVQQYREDLAHDARAFDR